VFGVKKDNARDIVLFIRKFFAAYLRVIQAWKLMQSVDEDY